MLRQLLHAAIAVAVIAVALRWAQIAMHVTQQPPTPTPAKPPPPLPRTADVVVLLAPSELSAYTGVDGRPIYLAIIGDVFDVSTGARHYAEGHSYAHMAGRDATRSFVAPPAPERRDLKFAVWGDLASSNPRGAEGGSTIA